MEPTDHCKICKNASFNSKRGIVCALTDFKPKFVESCQDYEEDDDAINIIKKLTKETQNPKYKKSNLIGTLIERSVIGIGILVGNYFLSQRLYELGWISTLSIFLFVLGLTTIASGLGTYLYYTKRRKFAEDRLSRHKVPFEYYRNRNK